MIKIGNLKFKTYNIIICAAFALLLSIHFSWLLLGFFVLYSSISVFQALELREEEKSSELAGNLKDQINKEGVKLLNDTSEFFKTTENLEKSSYNQFRFLALQQTAWVLYFLILAIDLIFLLTEMFQKEGAGLMFFMVLSFTLLIGAATLLIFRHTVDATTIAYESFLSRKANLELMKYHINQPIEIKGVLMKKGSFQKTQKSIIESLNVDDETKRKMILRAEFSDEYAKEKGWDINNLTFEQIKEIRLQDGWKNAK